MCHLTILQKNLVTRTLEGITDSLTKQVIIECLAAALECAKEDIEEVIEEPFIVMLRAA